MRAAKGAETTGDKSPYVLAIFQHARYLSAMKLHPPIREKVPFDEVVAVLADAASHM